MGNVTLPTPLALAGGAICVLGGYLLGVVLGPDTVSRTTAVVDSFDAGSSRLCLRGDGVEDQEGASEEGLLCGIWRRTHGSERLPRPGQEFRFVALTPGNPGGMPDGQPPTTVIYGDVVR